MFNDIKNKQIPLIESLQGNEEKLKADFVALYGIQHKIKAENFYEDNDILQFSYDVINELPAQPVISKSKKITLQQRTARYHSKKILNTAYQIAQNLEKKNTWFFGDYSMYQIGADFLKHIAGLVEEYIYVHYNTKIINFQELIRLTFLAGSPQEFLQSINNPYLQKYIEPIEKGYAELTRINQPGALDKLAQLEKLQDNIVKNKTFEMQIDQQINAIKESWLYALFGAGTKKIQYLEQIKRRENLINSQVNVLKKEVKQLYGIELAKFKLNNFKELVLDNPENLTTETTSEWQKYICRLAKYPNHKVFSKQRLNELTNALKTNIRTLAHYETNPFVDRLIGQIAAQWALLQHSDTIFTSLHSEVIKEIINQTDECLHPEQGLIFIEKISQALASSEQSKLQTYLNSRKEQYAAWKIFEEKFAILFKNNIQIQDIEEIYQALITMMQSNLTVTMKQQIEAKLNQLQTAIELGLEKLFAVSQEELPEDEFFKQLKLQLSLFNIEKLNFLQEEKSQLLKQTRKNILNNIIERIHDIAHPQHLQRFTYSIERIWPNGIFPRYVTLDNITNENITLCSPVVLSALKSKLRVNAYHYVLPGTGEHLKIDSEEFDRYKPAIANLIISPQEERTIYMVPKQQEGLLYQAIQRKRATFIDNKIKDKFKKEMNFLKQKEQTGIAFWWNKLTHQGQTPLTEDNLIRYGKTLIDQYIIVLLDKTEMIFMDQVFDYSNEENIKELPAIWMREELTTEIEAIAKSIDETLEGILNKDHLQKIRETFNIAEDKIDRGLLLIKWNFVNKFRECCGMQAYEHCSTAGVDIIHKMHELAINDPKFMHHLLAGMNATELTALENTFENAPKILLDQEYAQLDLVGDKQKIGYAGQTVLRKSLLLAQVSEIIKQKFLDFKNEDEHTPVENKIDIDLFNQQVDFVLSRLQKEAQYVVELQSLEFVEKLKGALLENFEMLLPKIRYQYIENLVKLSNQNIQKDSYGFYPQTNIKALETKIKKQFLKELKKKCSLTYCEEKLTACYAEYSLLAEQEIQGIPSIHFNAQLERAHASKKQCDYLFNVVASLQDDSIETVMTQYEFKDLLNSINDEILQKLPNAEKYESLKADICLAELFATKNNELQNTTDVINYIKCLPQNIVDYFPLKFGEFVFQMKYRFTNRFHKSLAQLLSEQNITEPADYEKLKSLRNTAFYHLVDAIIHDESDMQRLFQLSATTSIDIPLPKWNSCRAGWELATQGFYAIKNLVTDHNEIVPDEVVPVLNRVTNQ